VDFIVATATTRPQKLGQPFTHWSLRKLAGYLARNPARIVRIGRERLRQILHARGICFQRTLTWKESADPDKDARLDAIEHVTATFRDRCFAFDQFGPLSIRPCHGTCWAPCRRPARLPGTYHRTHGIRYYSPADDQLWGITGLRKGGDHSLAALKTIRAARPDGTRKPRINMSRWLSKMPTAGSLTRRSRKHGPGWPRAGFPSGRRWSWMARS
jgi:hypothetical protein